jgi:enoyl-CoA hydratase
MDITPFNELNSISVTLENHIAHIQLCRPKALNNMIAEFWKELPAALNTIDRSAEARVIVISAQGKHFTAGMDLAVFSSWKKLFTDEPARRGEEFRRWILELQGVFSTLESIRMPVITAIQGACIGGGVDMICASDMRFCTEDAFFCVKETAIGITADLGTLQRLPKLIPEGLAKELVYTARDFKAEEAKAVGFVNEVYRDQETMIEAVMKLAKQIAEHSPATVTGCKNMINYSRDHSLADSLNHMATWQSGMFQLADILEGIQAQSEKRQANYENLKPIVHSMD